MTDAEAPVVGSVVPRRRAARSPGEAEQCELCAAPLAPIHSHMVEPARHRLVCACDGCAILFDGRDGGKFKRVPREARSLAGFRLADAQWDAMAIPIGLAFFLRRSPGGDVAVFYPSPAGAIESQLPLGEWESIASGHPALAEMQSDVEALLVNRVIKPGRLSPGAFLVPVDACYRLVGTIRLHWRGFTGGTELWDEVARFFVALESGRG